MVLRKAPKLSYTVKELLKMPREDPRISITKLGEYLTTNPLQRQRILEDQKRPPAFQVARYTFAQNSIVRFLSDGANNETLIVGAIDETDRQVPTTDWDAQRWALCGEALEAFLNGYSGLLTLDGLSITPGDQAGDSILVHGVEISVRPEVILRGRDRRGNALIGAMKIYLSKNNPLGQEAGEYVATVVHRHAEELLKADGETVALKLCLVYDVFARALYTAPRSFQRRRQHIEAACQEIAARWPTI